MDVVGEIDFFLFDLDGFREELLEVVEGVYLCLFFSWNLGFWF